MLDILREIQASLSRLDSRLRRIEDGPVAADPMSQMAARQLQPGRLTRVRYGEVVDCLPFFGWYLVKPDDIGPQIACCLLGATDYNPVGPSRVGAIAPGSTVAFLSALGDSYGCILGCPPKFVDDPRQSPGDFISQMTATALAGEPANSFLATVAGSGMLEFAAGRAFDDTCAGYGYLCRDTGVFTWIDSEMVGHGVDEETGCWFTYRDQYALLSGHNLEVRAFGCQRQHFDDEGELSSYEGQTPYTWEALGALTRGATAVEVNTATVIQQGATQKTIYDVVETDQMPFHRYVVLGGYLGQGRRETVRVAPEGNLYQLHGELQPAAVFDRHTALDGSHYLRTACGLIQGVFPPAAIAERSKCPEDVQGDSKEGGYSVAGTSAPHKIAGEPDASELDDPLPAKLAGIDDFLAYRLEWGSSHALHYHEKDYRAADPAKVPTAAEASVDYAQLGQQQYAKAPDPQTLKIDHRQDGKIYSVTAFDATTPDGARIFTGSCGEEIRFAGGNIILACPGDIILQAGRRHLVLAGADVSLRSKQNVELSSTEGSVRIKGDVDVQMCAGNSGSGAILLDCRSEGVDFDVTDKIGDEALINGVLIKSKGQVAVLSEIIYLRSGAFNEAGWFRIDSATDTIMQAAQHVRAARVQCLDYFGADGEYAAVNSFTPDQNNLAGSLHVLGQNGLSVSGGAVVQGNIAVLEGHFVSSDANNFSGLVPQIEDPQIEELREHFDELNDAQTEAVDTGNQYYEEVVAPAAEDGRIASDDVVEQLGFSWRTSAQYKAEQFKFYEARWQQRLRLRGAIGATWTERAVETGSVQTMPFPGRDTWEGDSFLTVTPALYDVATGLAKPGRANKSLYEDAKYVAPEPQPAQGKFPITDVS